MLATPKHPELLLCEGPCDTGGSLTLPGQPEPLTDGKIRNGREFASRRAPGLSCKLATSGQPARLPHGRICGQPFRALSGLNRENFMLTRIAPEEHGTNRNLSYLERSR